MRSGASLTAANAPASSFDCSYVEVTCQARTFTSQVEALKRYRSNGQQTVRVERVEVNEGGKAIVGDVSYRRGKDDEKRR